MSGDKAVDLDALDRRCRLELLDRTIMDISRSSSSLHHQARDVCDGASAMLDACADTLRRTVHVLEDVYESMRK